MRLPLNLNPSYRSTLDIAFPVDILESNNCFDEEIFCHFYWQLCSYGEQKAVGFSHYNLMDNDWLFESVDLDIHSSTIIEEIRTVLLNGFYVLAFLDEFYIPNRPAFNQYHYMHGNLIFGFKQECGQLLAAAYDDCGKYTATIFTEQEFLNALNLKNNNGIGLSVVRAIKPRFQTTFPKNIQIFRYYIAAYFYSFDGFIHQTSDYGIQAINKMAEHIDLANNFLVSLYALMEHKKIMKKRLQIMYQHGYLFEENILTEYQSIVDKAQIIIMLYLKYRLINQIDSKQNIQEKLFDLVFCEQTILRPILKSKN